MRVEYTVVKGFHVGVLSIPDRRELRVYLSQQDRALLQRAAKLLEKMRTAADPHEWIEYGAAGDVPEQTRVLASAEAYVSEVASWGEYIVADDTPRVVVAKATTDA